MQFKLLSELSSINQEQIEEGLFSKEPKTTEQLIADIWKPKTIGKSGLQSLRNWIKEIPNFQDKSQTEKHRLVRGWLIDEDGWNFFGRYVKQAMPSDLVSEILAKLEKHTL